MKEESKNNRKETAPGTAQKLNVIEEQLTEDILVEISPDKMEIHVKISPVNMSNPPNADKIMEELLKQGLHFIDENALRKLTDEKLFGQRIKVGQGKNPLPPEDGKIDFFVNIENAGKPKIDKKGNVDYKNINLIVNVEKGAKLLQAKPPVPGKEGKTVTGEKVPVTEGKIIDLPMGKNTAVDPDNPGILISEIDGAVRLRDNNHVDVDSFMDIKTDIDYSTGNIDYNGSLVIKGDVKTGFCVSVKGNLEIEGIVEDADVEADGDIVIKQGCKGREGDNSIRAGGSISVKFGENHSLNAGKDITVSDYLMNCSSIAEGKISASGDPGLILGGTTIATKFIEAKVIGNDRGKRTYIKAGISNKLRSRLDSVNEKLKSIKSNLKKISKALDVLNKISIMKKGLPEDKKELQKKIITTQRSLNGEIPELETEMNRILKQVTDTRDVYVKGEDKIHGGVVIEIQNQKRIIDKIFEHTTFKLSDGNISPFLI